MADVTAGWPPGVAPASADPIELLLSKEDFKFNAAHFVVHERSRERLHGHNYRVSLMLRGAAPGSGSGADAGAAAGDDGYLVDFGELKAVMRALCGALNERFLLPTLNPHLTVVHRPPPAAAAAAAAAQAATADGATAPAAAAASPGGSVELTVPHDGSVFVLPAGDVECVPLGNVSVEGLAVLLARRFVAGAGAGRLRARGVTRVTLGVAESAGQEARFTVALGGGGGSGGGDDGGVG